MKKILTNTWLILDKKEKKHFSILILFDIIISIIDIVALALLLWIIQFYIQARDSSYLSFLPEWLADKESAWLIAIFFILFGLKNMAGFYIDKAHYKFNSQVAIRISRNKLVNYQNAGYDEFVNIDSSKHIRMICFQPFEFCQYILSGIQQIITQSCLIVITVLAILLFNAKLFLLLLTILLPPVIIVFYMIKKRMTAARKDIQTNSQRSYQYVLDALKGYVESNIYNRHVFFLQRFINSRKKFSTALFDTQLIQGMPGRIIEGFAILGLFILIAIAKWSGNDDTASLLTIGAFIAAAYKIIPGIVKITNISGQMRAYEFSARDLLQNNTTTDKERTPVVPIQSLHLKNASFGYAEQQILNGFNLSIQKKDFIGITGASGKGKTTILNILLGFLEVAKGEVLINDIVLKKDSIKIYWPSIAYVRQQAFFIHDTLVRNITLEEDGHDKNNLEYAVKVSGLNNFIAQFPEGLHKMITENGKNISGGQQQRITIARALYKNADLILLDEPFNELDEDSEISLLKHFRELAHQGKLIILVTHNKKSLSYCTKIISLDEQE
ncbi:MAG TPA: ABC transporter ATP-binding protein [Chitinophagaceae bacterium]|nr:ABC transporter ATP-binding protein [Chitinophagaceae bacterium]